MALAARDTGQARALMPFAVAGWSEEEALAQFKKFRFQKHGGHPYCADCDNPGVNTYKCRPIYKCKRCGKQFSNTSGTPWAHRKVSYRHLMQLLARFAHHKQGLVALSVAEDLGLQYKTVLLWLHKMRQEIMNWAATVELSGEVESDGAEVSGSVRPKNVKKKRSDHRRVPYRDKKRTFHLVAARQRGGPIRTWVARHESHAVGSVMKAISLGSTVFTDMAPHWSRVRSRFDLRQINHNEAFYTPEACTNQVESVWAAMRNMARNHRHIAQNYLDLYLADVAWTVGKAHRTQAESVAEVMACMSAPGRSELAGYFQGRKRGCQVVGADDSVSRWKPDLAAKPMRMDENGELSVVPPRRPLSKTWHENFEFVTAQEFLADPAAIADGPGVYAIFLREGDAFLESVGFERSASSRNWNVDGACHVYTGRSYGIRTRLLDHLTASAGKSNLRETLMALSWDQAVASGLPMRPSREHAEEALSDWLVPRAVIGFSRRGYIKDVEAAILDATASPLNIERRNPTDFQSRLKEARKRFRQDVSGQWPPSAEVQPRFRR